MRKVTFSSWFFPISAITFHLSFTLTLCCMQRVACTMPAGCEVPDELGPEAPWKLKPVATSSGFGLLHPLCLLILMEANGS